MDYNLNKYKKYALEPGGYFMRCSNGHSIYTMYGDYDCGQCQEEYEIEYERKLRQENEATDFDWEGNVDWDKYE
ncbi:hypothetical protein [Intestinibacter bartlettii]|uniref:Uncharacterized protein n=1 Tax=Intestinibacter bartlettii TaxID=261299 RepID=A0ABS6DV30_9FIRM|nr:hypothetical protein [Intestinibacter bartlettii]MBU5335698.1 hypothetical protein [Intestinibacter bartlettii]